MIEKLLKKLYKGDNKLLLLDQKYLPRWIVLLIDIVLCLIALTLVYFIILDTPVYVNKFISKSILCFFVIGVNVFMFFLYKTYSGIIRHSTFTDIIKLVLSSFTSGVVLLLVNFAYKLLKGNFIFSVLSIILFVLLSLTFMLLFRIIIKKAYQYIKKVADGSLKKRVAIFGADDHTISIGNALTTESNLPFKLVCFLTESFASRRYELLGKPVIPIKEDFSEILKELAIDGIIIRDGSLETKEKNKVVEFCLTNNVEVFNVPIVEHWNKKEDITSQIKPIQIEQLLERDPIQIDNELIKSDLQGKTILITGGAGSIGSEIVRQVADFDPKLVVILDQAESALHDLEIFLTQNFPNLSFIIELANISNMYRLEMLFSKYDFDIVYHAAAYKHVPLIERNPHEAIYVNILGTVNLSVLAVSNKIDKFVMVSTDKAVNPTNVMGASKRAAEMYVQSLQKSKDVSTRFITTRFGNVLGSNGSVIPHFRKQIRQGGPVTVTHKDIIRYFMTIPEACQLVLQAGTMGVGGEIYVFDMGKPVKILDMAERMIRLSGLEPYEDIDIKIIGLRPGEKLYEELLNDTSTSLPTHHPKIMISKIPNDDFDRINQKIKKIIKVATRKKDQEVVRLLKDLVPEYVSKNSVFEILDN